MFVYNRNQTKTVNHDASFIWAIQINKRIYKQILIQFAAEW